MSQDSLTSVLRGVAEDGKRCWKALVVVGLAYQLLAFVILTPLAGVLTQTLLWLGGADVLTDQEILFFLLKPIGWICWIIIGAVATAIIALEHAALLSVLAAARSGGRQGVVGALHFALARGGRILGLAMRLVGLSLLIAAPFLVVAGLTYYLLLTQFDINYYLQEKPPTFWAATTIGGLLAAGLLGVLAYLFARWFVALPFVLFDGLRPSAAMGASSRRTHGQRRWILLAIGLWALGTAVVSAAASAVVVWLGELYVPAATASLSVLTVAIGSVVLLWFGAHTVVSLVSTVAFSAILLTPYLQGAATDIDLAAAARSDGGLSSGGGRVRWSHGRLLALGAVAIVVLVGVGAVTINSLRVDDHVAIMAHRGASASAPENTLAAVRQAIQDGADWVEIDVQETADGEVVVFHDSDFKKLAGVDLKIWNATRDDLQRIDIGSRFAPEFHAERVPTLAQVLATCKDRIGVNIELKYYGHDQRLEQRVIDIVAAHEMESAVLIMSLKRAAIQKIKRLRPRWRTGLLMSVAAGNLKYIEADFLAVNAAFARTAFIRQVHQLDKEVFVWTINDAATMSLAMSRGVDGIITDKPALARRVIEQRSEMSTPQRLLLEFAGVLGLAPEIGDQ